MILKKSLDILKLWGQPAFRLSHRVLYSCFEFVASIHDGLVYYSMQIGWVYIAMNR